MPSQTKNDTFTDPITASLTSLVDAADALAKAATTLAAAARATADALSRGMQRSETPEEDHGINLGRGSDIASLGPLSDNGDLSQSQDINVDGSDHRGERSILATVPQEAVPRPKDTGTAGEDPGYSSQINPHYRLLLDNEADVLLFACALIDKRHKVVCYIPCGTPSLGVYAQLMEKVTGSLIYILNASEYLERNQGYIDFVASQGAILLVPEALLPQFRIQGERAWVIHVGWPASETHCTTQRRYHQAQNNILVAFSGDQSLYPAGEKLTNLSEPWPKDGPSFRASVSMLRPLYDMTLSEIPFKIKSQVYTDWIRLHRIHGSRHVEAWTPSMVLQRANDYLSNVLQWNEEHTGGNNLPLPEVTAGVKAQNSNSPGPSPSPAPWLDSIRPPTKFQPTIGRTYFTLDEQFDAVPLMCFISEQYSKVICFLGGQGILQSYQQLFTKITGRLAISPAILNNNQAIEESAVQFLSVTQPAILLLAYNTANLPSALNKGSVDCCIYWGFNILPKHVNENELLINCATTIIITLTPQGSEAQRTGIILPKDTKKHPSAAIPLDMSDNSILAPMRNKTKAVFSSTGKSIVRGLYTNRVYSVGVIPRSSLSAEDAARRANQYAARVLLHGDASDGSKIFPPIAGRPPVPKNIVEKFGLQPAVYAGLLTVEN